MAWKNARTQKNNSTAIHVKKIIFNVSRFDFKKKCFSCDSGRELVYYLLKVKFSMNVSILHFCPKVEIFAKGKQCFDPGNNR